MAMQHRFLFGDAADAACYWAGKTYKKYAVDVTAGPYTRPTFKRTIYVRATTGANAVECAKRNMFSKPPGRARYAARLAGPRELGCTKSEVK